MQSEKALRIDRALVLFLLLWAGTLHVAGYLSAGALWRDEANSIQQARLPSWGSVWHSLQYDSFPALYPSVLRIWSSHEWTAADRGLRTFGLLVGLALLAAIYIVARVLGAARPTTVLVLLAGNAVLVSEGDSIRPYGTGLLFLVCAYGFMGRSVVRPSHATLALAAISCVLAVQTSYANALSVGAICLCAAGVSFARGERRRLWRFLVPGFIAAVSLLPYAGALRRAGAWTVILKERADWMLLVDRLGQYHSLLPALAWLGFAALAGTRLLAAARSGTAGPAPRDPLFGYKLWVFLLSLAAQVAFVEAAGIAPFPRYFLPPVLFAAFAIEAALEDWKSGLRPAAIAAAFLLTAWPAWSWMRLRHTNVDEVAVVLAQRALARDLVVVSPWFLHPSFQRYYRGPCDWITVPAIERRPMMRYDLIKAAMLEPDSASDAAPRVRAALEHGGTIWFVSQRRWSDFARAEAPAPPEIPRAPGGTDYARFRSYWERDIEHRLRDCCGAPEIPALPAGGVWEEEDLILSGWRQKRD